MFSVSSSFSHKIVKFHHISGKEVFAGFETNNDFIQYFFFFRFFTGKAARLRERDKYDRDTLFRFPRLSTKTRIIPATHLSSSSLS